MSIDDTGPPYPPGPAPGSNGLGQFQIGISPLGTIEPFDWRETIISQFANSPRLVALIESINGYLDQTKNFDDFYDLIMNVDTAVGYGLDVWGRIVGVSRTLEITITNWFGFQEASPGSATFGEGAFYSGAPLTSNFELSDQAYRTLIFAKAAANITDGSIPSINAILLSLFPHRGNAYVTEGQAIADWFGFQEATNAQPFNQAPFYSGSSLPRMTMSYIFEFALSPVELAIVQQSGVLPKPTGVSATVVLLG